MADRYFQTNFGRSNRVVRPDFSSQFNIPNTTDTDTDWELTRMYEEPLKRYRTILSEEMPALQRLRSLGALVPKRDEYTPGFGGKLSAALAGFAAGFGNPGAAYQTAVNAREAPYRRALEDFGIEKEILGEQAELERYDRQNRLGGAKAELEALDDMLTQQRQFMDSRSQAALREAQIGNYGSLEADRNRRYGLDVDKFRFETDTKFPFEREMQRGQLDVSRGNLGVARGNLGLRGQELERGLQSDMFDRYNKDRTFGIARDRADAYTDYLGRGGRNTTPSPAAQARARQIAANELISLNPAYKKFIDEKGQYKSSGSNIVGYGGYNPKDDAFRNFRQEFEDRVDEILGRNKSTFSFEDLPDE